MSRHRAGRQGSQSLDDIAERFLGTQVDIPEGTLRKLSVRPPIPTYIKQLWQRRYFMQADASAKAFQTPRDLWLGKVWLIISPLIDAVMYAVIFGFLVRTSNGIENFPGYVVLGVTLFQVFQKYLTDGTDLVKKQQNLTKSFMFPRAALVFSQSLRLLYDTAVPMVVAICFTLATQYHEAPHWTIILFIPIFLLAHVFATGLMFIVARVTAFIPDSEIVVRIGQRFWFYASGIFYSVERWVQQPHMQELMLNNPGYQFLSAARDVVMYGRVPDLHMWLTLSAWALGTFIIGFLFYWQAEERYVTVK